MKPQRMMCPGAVSALLVLLAASVSAQKIDVKPGLWEITSAEPKNVQQACYTAELLNGGISQFPSPPGMTCKNDVVQETPRVVVTRTVCTGSMAIEGETRMEIASREAMSMQSTSVMTIGGNKQTIKASATYRWISANCGNVKPLDPRNATAR